MKSFESIKRNNDFKRLYKKGKSQIGKYLVIYALPNNSSNNKIGITVSKKLGNAVKRNRARRVIKEAYRLNKDKFKTGYDIVLVGRSRSVTAKTNQIEQCLLKLMRAENLFDAQKAVKGEENEECVDISR